MKRFFDQRLGILVLSVLLMGAWSCGYRFTTPGGAGSAGALGSSSSGAVSGARRPLFIKVFDNDTVEPGLSVRVSDAFSRRFSASGLFVLSRDGADLVLTGRVFSLTDVSSARQEGGESKERSVHLVVAARMTDKSGAVVWANSGIGDFENYTVVSGDIAATEKNRQDAFARLAERVAQKAVVLAEAALGGF